MNIPVRDPRAGFTLIEMTVVLGVLATLITMASVNLLRLQRHTHIQTLIATLVADLHEQRQRAMSGDTQGRSTTDTYGIHFETQSYTLFHGSTYSAGNTDNVVVPVQTPIQLDSTTFPSNSIVFTKGSGEIVGYNANANTVTFRNSTNTEQVTLVFNRYGTITSDLP